MHETPEALVIAVVLGVAVLGGDLAGKYLHLPPPWVWVVVGAALSFLPGLREISLPAEVVLYLFLPALLYWECLNSSLSLIRKDLRVIVLLSVGLVFTTAAVVAGIGIVLGLAPAIALVLGAVLSPTDSTAFSAWAPGLRRRIGAIIRGEGLLNDGSALALYTVAVAAVVADQEARPATIGLRFVYVVAIGILTGLIVAVLLFELRKLARRPRIDDTISLLTPFALYLPAALLGASGVVAVVSGGLLLARILPPIVPARSRSETYSFWRATTHLINGVLFVLIGLQARSVLATFVADGWVRLTILCVASYAAILLVRLIWVPGIAQLIRLVDRRPQQRTRREPFRVHAVIVWSGFRGAISLAAALSLPRYVADGSGFPDRGDLIAVTFIVIVLTLFVQGATFPAVARRARMGEDGQEQDERALARTEPVRYALNHLDEDAAALAVPSEARDRVRVRLEREIDRAIDQTGEQALLDEKERQLSLRAVARRRQRATELRNEGRIDDGVLLGVQDLLDADEVRLEYEGENPNAHDSA